MLFKATILTIKMQFKEHIFSKVHCNYTHMLFQREKLGIEIVNSILYGLQIIIDLNIVLKRMSCFAFVCYLFKDNKCKGKGADTIVTDGWRNWNIGNKVLLKHVGFSAHKAVQERYNAFVNPTATIDYHIEKWSDEDLRLYKIRLTYSLKCLKFLLHQGLIFRGHDESEESSNRGNFLELMKFLAPNSE